MVVEGSILEVKNGLHIKECKPIIVMVGGSMNNEYIKKQWKSVLVMVIGHVTGNNNTQYTGV